jgi:hypothetical protein
LSDNDSPYERAINDLVAKIADRMQPIIEDKRMVNKLCAIAGISPRFPDIESEASRPLSIRRDQFHAKPLATAVREYLEQRGPSGKGGLGAATVNEIFDALLNGGYKAETDDEENAKRGLRIALTKNSSTFYRVPGGASGGAYGLIEWYPNAKPQKPENDASKHKRGRPSKTKGKRGRPPKSAKTATDSQPVAAPELRKPGATGRKPGRPRKTPERKEEPHVVHEPDHSGPVTGTKAA